MNLRRQAIRVVLACALAGGSAHFTKGAVIAQWDFNSADDADPSTGTFLDGSGMNSSAVLAAGTTSFGTVASGATSDPNKGDNSQLRLTKFPAVSASNKSAGVQFSASTLGYRNIALSWDQYDSATASRYWRVQYTADGINWVDGDVIANTKAASWRLGQSATFEGIADAENNPNFAVRIVAEFESSATGAGADDYAAVSSSSSYSTSGTLWLDMFTITGEPIGPPEPGEPAISTISDQTIKANHPAEIAFQISDPSDSPDHLVLSASSSDGFLFQDISFGGSGGNRTIRLTPSNGMTGQASVTIRVTNSGGKFAETTFAAAVIPENTPPSISGITDQVVSRNSVVGPITFTINDAEQSPGELSLSISCSNPALVDATNLVVSGLGSDRTLSIVPQTNAVGSATITLTVSDGSLSSGTAFLLTVVATNAIAVWDFNTVPPTNDPAIPSSFGRGDARVIGKLSGSFGSVANGASSDPNSANNTMLKLSSFPAQGSENKQNGLEFRASTIGWGALVLQWDQYNSASASAYWRVQYTTNGTEFIDHSIITNRAAGKWVKHQTVTFSALPGVENNRNFAIRLVSEFESTALAPDGVGVDAYVPVDATANYTRAGTLWLDMVVLYGEPAEFENTPPMISPIPDQSLAMNSSTGPIPFTISDAESDPDSLTITASSANPDLVHQIIFDGSGTNRTVTLVPEPNQAGEASITIQVADEQSATSASTFTLRVQPPDPPPDTPIVLSCSLARDGLRLSWPAEPAGYILETCADLTGAPWTPLDQVPALSGEEWFVTVTTSPSSGFFRLSKGQRPATYQLGPAAQELSVRNNRAPSARLNGASRKDLR